MTPGEIPASMLTRLNVAFAYITADLDIKLIISVCDWSFSDPNST